MRRGIDVVWLIAPGLVLSFLLSLPATALAQQSKPQIESSQISIRMGADGNDTVEATYAVTHTASLKDGTLPHLLVKRPGVDVSQLQVSGAASGPIQFAFNGNLGRAAIKVVGEAATYSLHYTVRRAPGTFAIPIVVPDVPPASAGTPIAIETWLPQGQSQVGEWFPSVDRVESRDGRTVLVSNVGNIPSTVIADYSQGPLLNLSNVLTVIALAVLIVVFVWWFRHATSHAGAPVAVEES